MPQNKFTKFLDRNEFANKKFKSLYRNKCCWIKNDCWKSIIICNSNNEHILQINKSSDFLKGMRFLCMFMFVCGMYHESIEGLLYFYWHNLYCVVLAFEAPQYWILLNRVKIVTSKVFWFIMMSYLTIVSCKISLFFIIFKYRSLTLNRLPNSTLLGLQPMAASVFKT